MHIFLCLYYRWLDLEVGSGCGVEGSVVRGPSPTHKNTHSLTTYTHMCSEGAPPSTSARFHRWAPNASQHPTNCSLLPPSLPPSSLSSSFLLPVLCSSVRRLDVSTPWCLCTCAKCIFGESQRKARATAKGGERGGRGRWCVWGLGSVGGTVGERERGRETEDRWFKPEKKQSDEAKGGLGGGESS